MSLVIKTSKANHELVRELSRKFEFSAENIVARLAIPYSIALNRRFALEDIKDQGGKEYKEDVLFNENVKFRYYKALIDQHYGLCHTTQEIHKLLKIHLDNGLELIKEFFDKNPSYSGLDFLLDAIEKGISPIEDTGVITFQSDGAYNVLNYIKPPYVQPIRLKIGHSLETNEPILLNINDTSLYNNAHTAVAGKSGTGKTHFAFNLLKQIYEQTNKTVNFIFLDFKGIDDTQVQKNKAFFEGTDCTFINLPDIPFPINPLSFVDLVNESRRKQGINKFVDTIVDFANLGEAQKIDLRKATTAAFAQKPKGVYPTLREIYDAVEKIHTKQDSLISIMHDLMDSDIFTDDTDVRKLIETNAYINLPITLNDNIRFTCLFLMINYLYYTFMQMPDTLDENGIKGIRYVILIDEAHTIFKESKARELLDQMLRTIRSKGVIIILLSQGITEFNQQDFDFSSNCQIAFLLDINDKTNLKTVLKFLGRGEDEKSLVSNALSNIERYQAISNIKEIEFGKRILLNG